MKIICLNLWQGGNLFDGIIDFIKKEDPDILALQEVYNGDNPKLDDKYRSFEVIKESFSYNYYNFSPAFVDNRKEGNIVQGNAVFSKFPITSSDTVFFNEPYQTDYVEVPENFPTCPRNLQHVVIETDYGEMNVFNFQGVWDLDGDNYSQSRKNMSDVILTAVKNKSNVILTGDTNAKPTNIAMRSIEKELRSVFGTSVTSTFNMRRKDNPGYATAAVDMMFVSKNIKILSQSVPNVDISDHLPLVVSLSV